MGPMLMTGLACLGAALGHALVVSRTTAAESYAVRSLSIITMAFAQGVAVMGVVVGLLSIFEFAPPTAADGVLAGAPALAGAVVGMAIVLRNRDHTNAAITTIGTAFILGIGMLGVLVAVFAATQGSARPAALDDGPFVILAAVSGAAALLIGLIGSMAVGRLAVAGDQDAAAGRSAFLRRVFLIEFVGWGSTALAIFLLVSR